MSVDGRGAKKTDPWAVLRSGLEAKLKFLICRLTLTTSATKCTPRMSPRVPKCQILPCCKNAHLLKLFIRKIHLKPAGGGPMKRMIFALSIVLIFSTLVGCSGGSLSTREKGAGIGAFSGAAIGGIIGAAVGNPGAGAAIGGALGLGAGALVGDQLQGQELKQADQQRQIDSNQAELERQRRELERLRKQGEY
jgi:uncharacterized protein YqgC (DUF456 family)